MEQTGGLCQYLEWDSDFFGYRIARIVPTRWTPEDMTAVISWCATTAIDCIYCLADINNQSAIVSAESAGFHLVDVRVTLRRPSGLAPAIVADSTPCAIRLARPDDIPVLKDIARNSHRDSRFYRDGRFPVSQCDALYQTWIEKSCAGYADRVWVAEVDQVPAGYVTGHVLDATRGQIGLFAVSEKMRGQNVGRTLLAGAAHWFATQGIEDLTVVTQGGNAKALRLYERGGFLTNAVQLWYHRWFSPAPTVREQDLDGRGPIERDGDD